MARVETKGADASASSISTVYRSSARKPRTVSGLSFRELLGSFDLHEELGSSRLGLRIEDAREGVDDVIRCQFSTIMEFHAPPQVESPIQAVTGTFPCLCNRGSDCKAAVVLNQAVEKLLCDSTAIRVGDEVRI